MNRAYVIAVGLILFNLVAIFTTMLGVFPTGTEEMAKGQNVNLGIGSNSTSLASVILPTDNMDRLTSIVGAFSSLGIGVAAMYFTRSLTPLAVSAFATVYWTTLWKTFDILDSLFFGLTQSGALQFMTKTILGTLLTIVFIAAVLQIASGGWRSHV